MSLLDALFTPFTELPQSDKEHLVLCIRRDRDRVKPKKERKARAPAKNKIENLLAGLSEEELAVLMEKYKET